MDNQTMFQPIATKDDICCVSRELLFHVYSSASIMGSNRIAATRKRLVAAGEYGPVSVDRFDGKTLHLSKVPRDEEAYLEAADWASQAYQVSAAA